ncbi:MAG TPA: glutathione S-transferase [Steroidobacteraceae bacterium]|nr:glutathione S-transferase [Steroidobacteraceae bacterium]
MQLIGMLDSPYVRRVAVSLQFLGLPFEHRSVSVFRGFDEFRGINPVVKAPTLVCDDGTVLMDSTLILDYAQSLASRSLMPAQIPARLRALRLIGLALALCEKAIQFYYEHQLRPPQRRHAPWVDRVAAQAHAAMQDLEEELRRQALPPPQSAIGQDGISVAVAWDFVTRTVPDVMPVREFAYLSGYTAAAERLPQFRAAPWGEGTYRPR